MSKAKPRDTYLPVSLVDVKNLLQYDSARKKMKITRFVSNHI